MPFQHQKRCRFFSHTSRVKKQSLEPCYTAPHSRASNKDLTAFCQKGWHTFQPGAYYSQLFNSRSLLCCRIRSDALLKQTVLLILSYQAIPFAFCYCHRPCFARRSYLKTTLSLEPRLLLFAKQLSPTPGKRDSWAGEEKGKRHGNVDSQTRWDGVRWEVFSSRQAPSQLCAVLGSLPRHAGPGELRTPGQLCPPAPRHPVKETSPRLLTPSVTWCCL